MMNFVKRHGDARSQVSFVAMTTSMLQLHIGDHGKDLDDEVAATITAAMVRLGMVELSGMVANLDPPLQRARLAQGTMDMLGVPVAVATGTTCDWTDRNDNAYEFNVPYLADLHRVETPGAEMFETVARGSSDKQLNLVLMSGFTDAYDFFANDPDLFLRKVSSVTLMSGIEVENGQPKLDDNGFLVPNHTANNDFDFPAAQRLFLALQKNGIPMTIVTRDAAYAAKLGPDFYNTLAATGNPIGSRLQNAQAHSIQQLWVQANLPKGHPDRTLPWGPEDNPRDANWFRQTFCDGRGEGKTGSDSIWPDIAGFAQYDGITVLASHPFIRELFFDPAVINVNGTNHSVIGLSPDATGIPNPDALLTFFQTASTASMLLAGNDLSNDQIDTYLEGLRSQLGESVSALVEVVADRAAVDELRVRGDYPKSWDVPAPSYLPHDVATKWVADNTDGIPETPDPRKVDGLAERLTYAEGGFRVDEVTGRPLNPQGRTGVAGRGDLAYWGPNHAADPIVTSRDNAGTLHVLLIRRGDTGEWALPGGMVDAGEVASVTAQRELGEESGVELLTVEAREVWRGIVDDSRNTDNAWIESAAYHFPLSADETADALTDPRGLPLLKAGSDAKAARWFDFTTIKDLVADIRALEKMGPDTKAIYASHEAILQECHDRYFPSEGSRDRQHGVRHASKAQGPARRTPTSSDTSTFGVRRA